MTANTAIRLSIQNMDRTQTFGDIQRLQSRGRSNWTLSTEVVEDILRSRDCCSTQVGAKVVAFDNNTHLGEEPFFFEVTLCEVFCCGFTSAYTVFGLVKAVKSAASVLLERREGSLADEPFYLKFNSTVRATSESAQLLPGDMQGRNNDPTPFPSRATSYQKNSNLAEIAEGTYQPTGSLQ